MPDSTAPGSPDATAPLDTESYVIAQDWAAYTAEQHATWATLTDRLVGLLPGRAVPAFLAGMGHLPTDRIPDFAELSRTLGEATGWEVVAVEGLVPDAVFFDLLANRRFPAGTFIRRPDQLDYIEEPDVFHDVFGHVPMLFDPVFADYMEAYGKGGLAAAGRGNLKALARLYWYTVEFGLIDTADGLRVYGAGILSSPAEVRFALEDPSPNRIRLDLERVLRTDYRIDDFQETYFVIDSFKSLLDLADIPFGPLYDKLADGVVHQPGDILPADRVVHRGTGAYHLK